MENKEKTGVELKGIKAINPANNEEIPIFVADYVLGGYGTGAIMAVPAHDERDFEFAQKNGIKIEYVIESKEENFSESVPNGWSEELAKHKELTNGSVVFAKKGVLINSDKFDGMTSTKAGAVITKFVGGKMTSNYRLRDWSISRQRYWGCPIPIVYSPDGEAKFVGRENLPWILPEDVDFVPTGTAPLAKSKELKERTEKIFGKGWTPEVDTMDTFVDSSWYFLRYPDTENEKEFCSQEKLKRWMPVDLYIGGAEHTYMHLLFARFFIKAMKKIGLIDFDEPFTKLRHQGMVLDADGVKMSKSKGNVINPNDMVEKFGADAVRMYMMFVGPLEDDVMFKEDGVKGVYRFLEKVWKVFNERNLIDCGGGCESIDKSIPPLFHKTIKKVTEDIETLSFNTAISQMMIFVNTCLKQEALPKAAMINFLILLSPFAPHLAEELWASLGNKESIFLSTWPEHNPKMIVDVSVKLVIQVNGKVRDILEVPADILEDDVKKLALASEKIQEWIGGKEVKKIIYVKGKLISVVV
jgi:leucyl-tRNA synthetase